MSDIPDFQALAELWLQRDPRSNELDPEKRQQIVDRLASALEKRRDTAKPVDHDVGLIVNVPREDLESNGGLSGDILDQLAAFLKERIEDER